MTITDSTTERAPVVLREARQIQECREALKAAIQRIDAELYTEPTPDEYRWRTQHQAMVMGRLIEALDQAQEALFNVLNTAQSYCHCFAAEHVIAGVLGKLDEEQVMHGDALIAASVGLIDREGGLT